MKPCIVVFNAGSSTIKFSLFEDDGGLLFGGDVDGIFNAPVITVKNSSGEKIHEASDLSVGHDAAISAILQWIESGTQGLEVIACGHRVVHGGVEFSAPVIIDSEILRKLKDLIILAPLHQPHNIKAIEAFAAFHPDVPQVACFDTAFHHDQPNLTKHFALPTKYTEEGIIRYGFHGLSYQYIASKLPDFEEVKSIDKVVVAHLGNGASMCAMKDLKSVATTMGFTALDGLVMGTRCGDIDPGVILYLLNEKGFTSEQVSDLLYKESGLKGVSGISFDMRELLESNDEKAREAIELFCYQAAKQLAGLIPSMGGLDAIVFTAGIGEHVPLVRSKICGYLSWLGIELDAPANDSNEAVISSKNSGIDVLVVTTNEEFVVAKLTKDLL